MSRLKLGVIESDKPVNVSVRFPADVYRDLEAYAETLAKETELPKVPVRKLLVPIVTHFLSTDRGFSKARKQGARTKPSASS